MHATWNYLVKRSNGGFAFVGLYMATSTVIYAPFVIGLFFIRDITIGWVEVGFIIGTTIIHLAYSLTLQQGYKVGDLSIVYPVARGIAPIFVVILAIFIYDETLSLLTIIGIIFITLSVFILTGGLQIVQSKNTLKGLIYGIVIGVIIASYTILDKGAVSVFFISPLILQ